ncbi:MAG: Wzy polymerase domain-containing protein, partial [Nevskiales bacterium]
GYGWNQVTVAHVQSAHERSTYAELLSHSHNLLLDLVIWNGLPIGLLIIAGIIWWLVSRAWRCRSPESWFALLAIGCVGVHSLFEYPLDYAYFLLPVGLLIGLVEADRSPGKTFEIPRAILWLVVAASAFFMGLVWHEYRIVEADYLLMRFETRNIGPLKAEQTAPDIILLTQLREDLRMARSLARRNMSAEELEWMRRVTYRYPYYSNLFRYSLSLALNHRIPEASIEFRRLYDIYGEKPYVDAKHAIQLLAETQYPELKDWELP